jgi:hypothetical protein
MLYTFTTAWQLVLTLATFQFPLSTLQYFLLALTEPEFASHSLSFVVCSIPFCLLVEMCCSYFFALLAVKALDVSVLLFRRESHFFKISISTGEVC